MTEEELQLELECYKNYINPACDIGNMTLEETRDFLKNLKESENYMARLSDVDEIQ